MLKNAIAAVAVLLAASTVANAKSFTISLDGNCNVFTVENDHSINKLFWDYQESTDNGSCQNRWGGGVQTPKATNIEGIKGKYLVLSLHDPNQSTAYMLVLEYPLVSNATWYLFGATQGHPFGQHNQGSYTVNGTPDRTAPPMDRPH